MVNLTGPFVVLEQVFKGKALFKLMNPEVPEARSAIARQ